MDPVMGETGVHMQPGVHQPGAEHLSVALLLLEILFCVCSKAAFMYTPLSLQTFLFPVSRIYGVVSQRRT